MVLPTVQSLGKIMIDVQVDVLEAKYKPVDTVFLPMDMLEPYTKVLDNDFYNQVIVSMEANGLYYPLIIHQVEYEKWLKLAQKDGDIRTPDPVGTPLRYKVQCGNNRYWALKNYFKYTGAVECMVFEDALEAQDLCRRLRSDKVWRTKRTR